MSRPRTVRDLRTGNRSRALWQIFLDGPLTRQEIGAQAGLSPASVSNLVTALETERVVAEVGLEQSNGGRPRGLVQVNPEYGYVIGVDVGESTFLVELFDFALQPRARHRSVTDMSTLDPDDAVAHIVAGIEAVIAAASVADDEILGVGVAVPGVVEQRDHAVVYGQSVGWDAVPLESMLRRRTSLPILVDNGARALGQAEKWFGAARGAENAVIVLLGLGVGMCIICNGEVYRGATGSAGEWGHTAVVAGGRTCRCGAAGCLEAYVGAGSVVEQYDQISRRRAVSRRANLEEQVTAIIAARASDSRAAQVLDEAVTYLGVGLAGLVNVFNPERVVVGGWLGRAFGQHLLPEIRAAAERQALRMPFRHVEIVPAQLGMDAVALGGATLPIAKVLDSGAVEARQPAARRGLARIALPHG